MRIPSRRSIATLIRIRQELDKRLDPVVPRRAGSRALHDLIDAQLETRVGSAGGDSLRAMLADSAQRRFPLDRIRGRDPSSLPARDQLLEQVEATARGEWSVFQTPIRVELSRHEWTRHPITGAKPADRHWSNVPYISGIGGGDVKQIWELSRHTHLVRLAQGYFLTGDEQHADRLLDLLTLWIAQNPPGRGINWVSSLEVSFRSIAWCWIWALTCNSTRWTHARLEGFLVSLWHHARHVERFDSIHHSPNTHLTGEGLGLMYVGLLFPELRGSARWARRGVDVLESELEAQVLSDGMHFERAVGYHRYTAEFYLHFLLLADAFGLAVAPRVRDRVKAQVAVTALLRRPDGTWPVIGDEDGGDTLLLGAIDPQDQGAVLAVGGAYFGQREWMEASTESQRAVGWWMLEDAMWSDLRASRVTGDGGARSGALDAAGYYVGRETGAATDWWCLVDAGPHGGDQTGHAHTDLAHVEIARGTSHIVTDPGSADYTTDPVARNWARSEAAHACLVIDDAPLAIPAGPFSWQRVAPTPQRSWGDDGMLWWCELAYDRPHAAGRLSHRRQVVLVRGLGVIVCDWIEGDAPVSLALHWPLGGAPHTLTLSDGVVRGDGYRVAWLAGATGAGLAASLEPMMRSPGYGRQMEGRLLRLGHRGTLPLVVVTAFSESSGVRRVQSGDAGALDVEIGNGADEPSVIRVEPGAAPSLRRLATPALSFGIRN